MSTTLHQRYRQLRREHPHMPAKAAVSWARSEQERDVIWDEWTECGGGWFYLATTEHDPDPDLSYLDETPDFKAEAAAFNRCGHSRGVSADLARQVVEQNRRFKERVETYGVIVNVVNVVTGHQGEASIWGCDVDPWDRKGAQSYLNEVVDDVRYDAKATASRPRTAGEQYHVS
jgi:hypothetical protein